MKFSKKYLVPAVTAALLAAAAVTAPAAQEGAVSATDAHAINGHLSAAFITTNRVEELFLDGKFTATERLGRIIAVIDDQLARAERLSGGHHGLIPGIVQVRENLARVVVDGKVSPDAATLLDDSLLKLHALGVNSRMVESLAHMHDAARALEAANARLAMDGLQQAGEALAGAHTKGGYHIPNDLDEIQVALYDMSTTTAPQLVAVRPMLDERMVEVSEHLYEVGTTRQ